MQFVSPPPWWPQRLLSHLQAALTLVWQTSTKDIILGADELSSSRLSRARELWLSEFSQVGLTFDVLTCSHTSDTTGNHHDSLWFFSSCLLSLSPISLATNPWRIPLDSNSANQWHYPDRAPRNHSVPSKSLGPGCQASRECLLWLCFLQS